MIPRVALWIALFSSLAMAGEIVPTTLPAGLGVNIHFTDPKPGEMKMLAAAGFKFVRMDFDWIRTEKTRGVYDFAPYERLLKALDEHQIRAVFILDYANPLYDDNKSPCTDEGRKAFAAWAGAAAKHFAGRGILWEMYNEPNISPFWRPAPNPDDYVKLAVEVGKALRAAAPEETFIGPASSTIDLPFLETCFKAGVLEYFSAVSVHPYRQQMPETVEPDYLNLRLLIAKYAPAGKKIPIFSGEWGYSSVWSGFDPEKQAQFLPRQWLINQACEVPLSIWYDWHDDGTKADEPEHHFGTVLHEYREGADPIYTPKPAYQAAKALTTMLAGFTFNKRLAVGKCSPTGCSFDYVLLFDKGPETRLVAWSTVPQPHDVTIPASAGTFTIFDHLGADKGKLEAGDTGLTISMSESPQYAIPDKPNDILRLAAAWERAPLEIVTKSTQSRRLALKFHNPLDERVHISSTSAGPSATQWVKAGATIVIPSKIGLLRDPAAVDVPLNLRIGSNGDLRQKTACIATDALDVTVLPPALGKLPVRVENPSGDPFDGSVVVSVYAESGARVKEVSQELHLPAGQSKQIVTLAVPDGMRLIIEIVERADRRFLVGEVRRFAPINLVASDFEVVAEGDKAVKSTQTIEDDPSPPDLPPGPVAGVMKLTYAFDAGWKYLCIKPRDKTTMLRRPVEAVGLWVRGDGSGNIARARLIDSTNQVFQADGPRLTDQTWHYIELPLDGTSGSHWSGANDGQIHDPTRLETLLLLDSTQLKSSGAIYLANPTLIFSEQAN